MCALSCFKSYMVLDTILQTLCLPGTHWNRIQENLEPTQSVIAFFEASRICLLSHSLYSLSMGAGLEGVES